MNKFFLLLFLSLSLVSHGLLAERVTSVEKVNKVEKIKQKYIITKNKISNSETFTRRVSATLSKINQQMRKIRRKKNKLNSQSQGIKIKIDELNSKITNLENNIKDRKSHISKQLRALYKMSNLNQMMYILNAKSIHEFEQNTKFLKMYSESDYDLIIEYSQNIAELKESKIKLSENVKKLKITSNALNVQNKNLNKKIKSKRVLLSHLKKQRIKYFDQLSKIKNNKEKLAINDKINDLNDIFGTDFFDKRGTLSMPVSGSRLEKFGVNIDHKYKNKIKNNGIFIESQKNKPVRSVHPGEVSYVGEIRGLGKIVIIEHGDHYYTVYGNNHKVFVSEGDKVTLNQKIGSTGYSPYHNVFGSYFEIRYFTEPVDPSKWLASSGTNYSQL